MVAKANLKLGSVSYQFEIEEKNEMDTLHKIIILTNPRKKCVCSNEDSAKFSFTSNKDKEGNTYVNVKCEACGARSKLGQYKTGGYFWHEFEKYVPKTEKTTDSTQEKQEEEEFPF